MLLALVVLPQVAAAQTLSSNLSVELTTDKACYAPNQTVTFTASGSIPSNAIIRYRHGMEVVKEENYSSDTWTWTPPTEDFKGYMVDVYTKDGTNETVYGTIAVDVSSDWKRFPRYGFVADFEEYGKPTAKESRVVEEMKYLNRCHINGVQFQDWHYKHHYPVAFDDKHELMDWYQDISNRYVGRHWINRYIEEQHKYGMKSIFYNLCFGVLDDAQNDGVDEKWNLYVKNGDGTYSRDYHDLPSNWKSNIYLVNPANEGWQSYLADRNEEVYTNFAFDGYQIDQLGGRSYRSADGKIYDYNHNEVDLPFGYASFINAMKARHNSKSLIMNAVSGYGAEQILGTGKVDFCYNEVWGGDNGYGGASEDAFANLYGIIKNNDKFSNNTLRTVFAAYMNYDKADRTDLADNDKLMNTPGVLLTDAVMFALGGSHLELGDHMLSREYFPAAPLAMTDELKTAMIRYYDFMTAYQNLLRDNTTKNDFSANVSTTSGNAICAWPPKAHNIVTYSKNVGTSQVYHFLNFLDTDDLSWRDKDGTRSEPALRKNIEMTVTTSKNISKVWAATPDADGGIPQELSFTQDGDNVTFTLPSLKYWTMVVFEGENVSDNLYIVGEATSNNWNISDDAKLSPNEDGSIFTGVFSLKASDDNKNTFKFVDGKDYGTCLHYNAEYENYNFNEQYNINTANLVVNSNTDFSNGAKDYKFTVAEDGTYKIIVNINTLRIQVDKVDNVAEVKIGSTGYATYCNDKRLDFSKVDDMKAYIATGLSGTGDVLKLIVQNITDVPANTGLLLHGTPGTYYVPFGDGSSSYLNYCCPMKLFE